MTDTSWRNWEVKNGVYATDNSGAVTHWVILSITDKWEVLGTYNTEEDSYCIDYDYGEPENEWAAFLQDEAIRLAEEKGLVPKNTGLLICCQEGFHGSQIMGYEAKKDDSPNALSILFTGCLKSGEWRVKND